MTDAPERIWLTSFTKDQYGARLGRGTVSDLDHGKNPEYPEYVRKDLHTYDAGFAAGIEAAVGECELRDCGDSLIEAIRALAPTAPAPVSVQEAAAHILSSGINRVAPVVLNAVAAERSKWESNPAMMRGDVPAETVTLAMFEACLRALAEQEDGQ